MDPLDPLDPLDIPFADEDPTIPIIIPITTTSMTPASQNIIISSISDAGDKKSTSQEQENVPVPSGDAILPENRVGKNQNLSDTTEVAVQETVDVFTNKTAQKPDEERSNVKQETDLLNRPDLINTTDQDSGKEDTVAKEKICEVSGSGKSDENTEKLCDMAGMDGLNKDSEDAKDSLHQTSEKASVGQTPDILLQVSEKESEGDDISEVVLVTEVCDSSDRKMEDFAPDITELTQAPVITQSEPQDNEPSVEEEDTTITVTEETEQTGSEDLIIVDSSKTMMMDMQGETRGGKTEASLADDLVDDFFGTTASSETVTNGIEGDPSECILRIDESIDDAEKDNSSSRPRLNKESSPEIIVGSVDSVENVTLKDATSEKALLSNGDDEGISSQRDSLSSRTDEDKRKSSSDMDIDFAVLEVDSSHLNLDMSKQKTSLRKRGSLARRKKPSRGSVTQGASDSSDSMFQDSTDSKPVTSPTSDTAEDDVFHKHAMASEPQQTEAPSTEGYTVRKAAQPFKPSMVMPGLQDLSKSKLFNQERKKSGESPTSPVKSPLSPLSPTHKPVPPMVLPKPTTKGQKDSQNKTIAAENSTTQSVDSKSVDSSDVSSNVITASVEEAVIVPNLNLSDNASSLEGPKSARGDSGSLPGPKLGRTDSWSSVSSPRRLSRGDSVSSMEGGEAGSATSTPRRASIQGSAYAPIGFRPRRSSSIVLDSNNKLVDIIPPQSPSPTTSTASALEEDSEALISSGIKSSIYKPPVWLSEIKAKTGATSGDSGTRFRSTSGGSNDGSAVSVSSTRSRNSSESAGSVDSQSVSDAGSQKKQEGEEPEKPSWMKAADQSTSLPVDKSLSKKEDENGEEEDKKPSPPWAAELKMKNRPVVTPRTTGTANGKMSVSPYKATNDNETAPVVSSGRDEYSPSWMKTSRQVKKPPPPVVPSKPVVAIGSKPAVKPSTQNPMKQYETPKWKLDLAEKKKRREAEMMPAVEEGAPENSTASSTNTNGSSSSSSDVPQWRQQLSLRKKQPGVLKEESAETESAESGPNWAKQAEERRARLIKAGLFDKAEEGEEV